MAVATGTTGAIGELVVAADLMRRGYPVFRSLSPTCPCDLIAIAGGMLVKVEVRTTTRRANNSGMAVVLVREDFERADAFGLWVRSDNSIIYVPDLPEWGKRRVTPQDMDAVVKPRRPPIWLRDAG